MKPQYLILIALSLVTILKSSIAKEIESFRTSEPFIEGSSLNKTQTNDPILIEQRVWHTFSALDKKDEFHICIRGKSIAKGQVTLTIINSNKVVIFKEEFPSNYLLDYGFDDNIDSVKGKEKYIKKRISEFFHKDNFHTPAIERNETFKGDYSDETIWNDIKSDQKAVGFSYLIGEENRQTIAYSKKTKKVVVYFSCC